MYPSQIVNHKSKIRLFWILLRKDMSVVVRTPYALISVATPVLLSIIFMFIFPATAAVERPQIAIYDEGASQLAAALAAQPDLEIVTVTGPAAVVESITGGAVAGMVIPGDFDTAVQQDQQPPLTIYLTGRSGNRAAIATFQRLLSEGIWQLRHEQSPAAIEWQTVAASQSPAESLQAHDYLLILLLVITLVMVGATVTSTAIVDEKGQTLYPLLHSPISAGDVILSKVLTSLLFTLLAAAAVLLLNQGWQGDWPLTAVALLLGALFTVGVGLLLGLAAGNRSTCNTWSGVVTLALSAPVWFVVTPLEQLPVLLRLAVQVIPTHYLIVALTHTLQQQSSLLSTGLNLAILGGATILVYTAAMRHLAQRPLNE